MQEVSLIPERVRHTRTRERHTDASMGRHSARSRPSLSAILDLSSLLLLPVRQLALPSSSSALTLKEGQGRPKPSCGPPLVSLICHLCSPSGTHHKSVCELVPEPSSTQAIGAWRLATCPLLAAAAEVGLPHAASRSLRSSSSSRVGSVVEPPPLSLLTHARRRHHLRVSCNRWAQRRRYTDADVL
jgi:hypothetical protein